MVFRLQPHRYATEETQVGLIGSLLIRTALSWFSSLLEKDSPLLADLDQFLEKFSRTFGERSSPYSNNKTSNTTTTITPSFSIRCRISTTCMWPQLERHSSHHHVSMGTPRWYQNLVAKLAQTNYSVGSHYSSNRLRQPAVRAATRATTALWIISNGLHSSNPPNIFKHFDPRAHANWHFEG